MPSSSPAAAAALLLLLTGALLLLLLLLLLLPLVAPETAVTGFLGGAAAGAFALAAGAVAVCTVVAGFDTFEERAAADTGTGALPIALPLVAAVLLLPAVAVLPAAASADLAVANAA